MLRVYFDVCCCPDQCIKKLVSIERFKRSFGSLLGDYGFIVVVVIFFDVVAVWGLI